GSRGCSGKLYTNLDATEIIRTGEHAEGCRVDAHAFYHQQQLNELKRLAAGDLRPKLQLEPAKFVCDFETALIPAIQGNFPNTRVQGCFFHFCQAVLRQVGRLGLRNDYINNQEIRKKVKMLMALAFCRCTLYPRVSKS
ncbi:hypothetical protein T09_2028, partial [Trichinella sp. T9]